MTSKDMALVASLAALTAALGLMPAIPLPVLPVPITAQTLGVMIAGGLLGPRRGAAAMSLVVILVAIGLPVLAGGRGGMGVFFGPSAGFLLAWPLGAAVTGWLALNAKSVPQLSLAVVLGGIFAIYLVGIPWMAMTAELDLWQALLLGGSFLPGDLVKAVLAVWIIRHIRRSFPEL